LAFLRVGNRLALFYIHQMNRVRVNSCNDFIVLTNTINIILSIIITHADDNRVSKAFSGVYV